MKRVTSLIVALAFLAVPLAAATTKPAPKPLAKEILSDVYTIEKRYRSMEGPGSMKTVLLDEDAAPELLWITGVRTTMVGEDGTTAQLAELMCHVNVDIDPIKHQQFFNFKRSTSSRLVTLSQGMLSMTAPRGFGFPIISNEPIYLYTQVLNHNIENPGTIKVRHRVTFEFVRDRDLAEPMKPLFNVGASGMVLLEENPLAVPTPVDLGGAHGATCLMAPRAPNAAGKSSDYTDPMGRKLTGHWVVPPGRQVNHTDITWFMSLPYDSKLHYSAIHLHPFAESLTLRDVTAKKEIFTVKATNPKDKVGLDHVETFTSTDGIKLYKDHQYELVSVYNNPTKETHDSMASIFLGLHDPEFVKPSRKEIEARADAVFDSSVSDQVSLHTTAGLVGVSMARQTSPTMTRAFLRLARAGGLAGANVTAGPDGGHTPVVTFTATLNEKQKQALGKLALETTRRHEPGSLSVCPEDIANDTFTFSIVLGPATHRDGRCTAFAQIGPGADVLRQIYTSRTPEGKLPNVVSLQKAELFKVVDGGSWVPAGGM